MGDQISIPRTFSGLVGTVDVNDSIKRHYLSIPINQNNTTGIVFGGNQTTVFNPLQRNATIEKFLVTARYNTTTAGLTTILKVNVFGPGTTTLFSLNVVNDTTIAVARVFVNSTGPVSAAIATGGAAQPVRVEFATRLANVDRISMVLVFKEANS